MIRLKISILVVVLCLYKICSIQAQELSFGNSFSIQGKEEAETTMTLTAIAGQPFEGTQEGIALSYGFIEVVLRTMKVLRLTPCASHRKALHWKPV